MCLCVRRDADSNQNVEVDRSTSTYPELVELCRELKDILNKDIKAALVRVCKRCGIYNGSYFPPNPTVGDLILTMYWEMEIYRKPILPSWIWNRKELMREIQSSATMVSQYNFDIQSVLTNWRQIIESFVDFLVPIGNEEETIAVLEDWKQRFQYQLRYAV